MSCTWLSSEPSINHMKNTLNAQISTHLGDSFPLISRKENINCEGGGGGEWERFFRSLTLFFFLERKKTVKVDRKTRM